MAQVVMRSLNKKYDEVHAVKDVNLDIRDQEFVVLVGPSGCGKTTTLRMVAGLESITSGRILIDDTVVNDLPPMDRDIAMVFQNYALYPHMSVRDNMAYGLKIRKLPRAEIEARVRRAAGILSAGIFAFTLSWNEFIYALVFLSSPEQKTIPVGVTSELVRGDVFYWGELMAGALLGSIPVAFVYSFFVEYYVSGITGSVKG